MHDENSELLCRCQASEGGVGFDDLTGQRYHRHALPLSNAMLLLISVAGESAVRKSTKMDIFFFEFRVAERKMKT